MDVITDNDWELRLFYYLKLHN